MKPGQILPCKQTRTITVDDTGAKWQIHVLALLSLIAKVQTEHIRLIISPRVRIHLLILWN